jgi:hypothetical protein
MNLLVIINSKDQPEELGMVIDSVMKKLNWIAIPNFPYTYTKEEKIDTPGYISTVIQHDIGVAADQAGWSQVRYLYTVSAKRPQLEATTR